MCQPERVVVHVTGFGPFGSFEANPSQRLAEGCGLPHTILEVSFEAVDRALDGLSEFDALLMIGVAGNSPTMRMEAVAHNSIGPLADVRGVVAGPGQIDPAAPRQLHGNLWTSLAGMDCSELGVTSDAGTYLCNYALFRAIQKFPERRVGFLHVPPETAMPLHRQAELLERILAELQAIP